MLTGRNIAIMVGATVGMCALFCQGCAPAPVKPSPSSQGGGGVILAAGVPVAKVSGSPKEIGIQMGSLLGPQMRTIVRQILLSPQFWMSDATVAKLAEHIRPAYRVELEAMADAAGIRREELLKANVSLDTLCTVLVCGADGKGPTRIGRNMDFFPAGILGPATVVLVRHPQGARAFAAVTWPGYGGVITGMNDAGVTAAILLNFGSGHAVRPGTPVAFRAREILEEAATLQQAVDSFGRSPVASGHFLLLADARNACIVWQDADGKVHRRDAEGGWLAWSNGQPDEQNHQHEWRAECLAKAIASSPAPVTDLWLKQTIVAVRLKAINTQVMLLKSADLSLELARARLASSAGAEPWVRLNLAGVLGQGGLESVKATETGRVEEP